jgi:hypothetical protein
MLSGSGRSGSFGLIDVLQLLVDKFEYSKIIEVRHVGNYENVTGIFFVELI